MAHPADDLLLSFATGRADLPHRVMIEAHLAGCAPCRATVAEVSAPGGALLSGLTAEAPPTALWNRVLSGIEAPRRPEPSPLASLPLPEAALAELPETPQLRWHWGFAPGARYTGLVRDPFTHSVLLIGHTPPRRAFPRHQHLGPEDVVLLRGGYEDEMGHYEAGQYVVYAPGTVHRPIVEPGEECWILTRLEKPNRLLGWAGWLQRLTG